MEHPKKHAMDPLSEAAEASIAAAGVERSKLNIQLVLSALANLLIVLSWFVFSAIGISNARLVLGLLLLTMLAWLWLIVAAGRRFVFWNGYERQRSNFRIKTLNGMHRRQRSFAFAFVAVLIFLGFLWLVYSHVDDWVLQLLRKIGTDCVWCSIAPP